MSAPEPQRGLIHALCHELSNLMAGVRLHTHLITPGAPPGDLENAASTIADVSLRAGALVAQVRPLLAPGAPRVTSVAPADVLAELELFLDDETPGRSRSTPRRLPICPRFARTPRSCTTSW